MELISTWELTAPALTLGRGLMAWAPGDAGRAALAPDAASAPWRLASSGETLRLIVGPLQAGSLGAGLEAYGQAREQLEFSLPPEVVREATCGVRLAVPHGALGRDALEAVAHAVAPLASPLLAAAGAGSLTLIPDEGAVEARLERVLPPDLFDTLALVLAGLLRGLLRDVAWDGLAATPQPDLVVVRGGTVEVAARGAAASSAPAAALWSRAQPDVLRFARRGDVEVVQRMLEGAGVLGPAAVAAAAQASPAQASVAPPDEAGGPLRIVPFRPGARPIDELIEPGSGASERIAFLRSGAVTTDEDGGLWLLFRLDGSGSSAAPTSGAVEVRAWAWFLPHEGEVGDAVPVPGLSGVAVPARVVAVGPDGKPALEDARYALGGATTHVASLAPRAQLFPGGGWRWEDAAPSLRARCPDGEDPYTFGNLFHQRLRVKLAVFVDGRARGGASAEVEVYDTQRFGSLYDRVLALVAKDTAAQAAAARQPEVYTGNHPWYPVLSIGMNKAAFYMKAIHEDLADQTKHLADPRWLLRVGLFLEYLTCVGIFEAVRAEHPDLLSPAERRALQESPLFEEVRSRINVERWREVWGLRKITMRGVNPIAAGPVAFTNLLEKQRATLAFLHAHHADLQHAIELAGPNLDSSQEAWQRVFRDAERAIVNTALGAFPELRHLPAGSRDFVLWHRKDDIQGATGGALPGWLTGLFGDQDGVYPNGAREYRASMNHVADWARARGLMDHAGAECVPREASLIESLLEEDEERFAALQAHDGYAGALHQVTSTVALPQAPSRVAVVALLRRAPLFAALDEAEVEGLAGQVRRVTTVPAQDVVVAGAAGSSLFLVHRGSLEAFAAQGGRERSLGRLRSGAVFGEMALLTGEPRAATVRSVDYAELFELPKAALQPLIERRPRLIDALSEVLAARSGALRDATREVGASRAGLGARIRGWFLGERQPATATRLQRPAELERLLRRVPVFAPLADAEVRALAERATSVECKPGEVVVSEGDKGSSLFVVERGAVEVAARGRPLGRLEAGAVFGEMALLTGERRAATVRAAGPDVRLVELSKSDLWPLVSQRPGIIIEMSALLEARQSDARGKAAAVGGGALARMRSFFFGA